MSVEELADAFRTGEISPVAVLDQLLERIARLDPAIGAFTFLHEESAREAAASSCERLAAGQPLSQLDGIPVGVKEIFDVAGWPATGGSLAFADQIAQEDAELVRHLRGAGAVIVGLTRSHELALGITTQHETRGSTRNPWDLSRIPGGSSGGSGAAVAAGLVPLAVASDTSGSVRIPAAFCGVCGIRPSHGLLPLDGVVPLAPSYDAAGFIAREVGDLVIALDAVAGGSAAAGGLAMPVSLVGRTVGISREPSLPLHPAVAAAFEEARRLLTERGAEIVEVDLPSNSLLDQAMLAQIVEMVTTHTATLGTWPERQELLGEAMRERLGMMVALGLEPGAGEDALKEVRAHVTALEVDCFLAPTSNRPPSTTAEPEPDSFLYEVLRSSHLQAFVGGPAVSVPAGMDDDGLPVGVQVWAHPGGDSLVLGVAAQLRDGLRSRLPAGPPLQ